MTRIQVIAVLILALAVSVGLNLWQLYRAGGASAKCETAQVAAGAKVVEQAIDRDTESVEVGRETTAAAEEAVTTIQTDTAQRQETVRVIYRTLPPADPACPRTLPGGVRDTLAEAVAAANRQL